MTGSNPGGIFRAPRHPARALRVIPVLDLMNGAVVRGVAGNRDSYRPIESELTSSAAPLDVAAALRDRFETNEFYLADLDAIQRRPPHRDLIRALAKDGHRLLVDAGLRDLSDAQSALDDGASAVVAGLETIPGPETLEALCRSFGSERVIFSLDLKSGQPLGSMDHWESASPGEIARVALAMGVRRMIVLDLAQVGVRQGLSTLELCADLRASDPELELITGGGIRGPEDLAPPQNAGIDALLIATALHEGRITRKDLEKLRQSEG